MALVLRRLIRVEFVKLILKNLMGPMSSQVGAALKVIR